MGSSQSSASGHFEVPTNVKIENDFPVTKSADQVSDRELVFKLYDLYNTHPNNCTHHVNTLLNAKTDREKQSGTIFLKACLILHFDKEFQQCVDKKQEYLPCVEENMQKMVDFSNRIARPNSQIVTGFEPMKNLVYSSPDVTLTPTDTVEQVRDKVLKTQSSYCSPYMFDFSVPPTIPNMLNYNVALRSLNGCLASCLCSDVLKRCMQKPGTSLYSCLMGDAGEELQQCRARFTVQK